MITSKTTSLIKRFEDLSTLKMKKYKLILKKKELSKTIEMNRILKSDNIKTLSHWDILLSKPLYNLQCKQNLWRLTSMKSESGRRV